MPLVLADRRGVLEARVSDAAGYRSRLLPGSWCGWNARAGRHRRVVVYRARGAVQWE